MKLSILFNLLNRLKIDHWQTESHAEHKALGEAYEELDPLVDRLVELYYGRNHLWRQVTLPTVYVLKLPAYNKSVIDIYTDMRNDLIEYLNTITTDSDSGSLKNIQDEIEGALDQLLYKLRQS
jgi:hypothetical protein